MLSLSCLGSGSPVLIPRHPPTPPALPWPLTCGSQADLHAASLEFTAALMLGHNEVAAATQAGYEGGEVAVLAAAKQMGKVRPGGAPD